MSNAAGADGSAAEWGGYFDQYPYSHQPPWTAAGVSSSGLLSYLLTVDYALFIRFASRSPRSPLDIKLFADLRAVRAEPFEQDGQLAGVDLALDPSDPTVESRLEEIFALALPNERLTVFDPQLGRTVTAADIDALVEQMRQLRAFVDAAPISLAAAGPAASPTRWVWIALAGLFLLLIVLDQAAGCLL